jgi:branched-chain amino acid transport system permease protein
MVALGFALVFSVAGILNLAHGAIYMVGGYVCYLLWVTLGLNPWLALLLTMLITGLIGLFIERVGFRHCQGSFERVILMCLAIILILETGVNVTLGATAKGIPPLIPGNIVIWGASVAATRLVALVISALLLAAVFLFIQKGKLGQEMLAISQDEVGAVLQGINVNRVSGFACALGCAIAGLAGGLMGSIMSLNAFMGDTMLVKACALVIIGGIGSIGGILPAGLILGTIDGTLPLFISGHLTDVLAFGLIILILLIRPRGLFGRET